MNQRVLRGMGWLPDVPSVRDYSTSHPEIRPLLAKTRVTESLAAPPALPDKVDLRAHFPPVVDQQNLGACTANAAAALIGYFEKKALGRSANASRLFIYKAMRNLTGTKGDAGAYLRTTMEALALFGAPPEDYWPYDGSAESSNNHFDMEPNAFCYAFARNFTAMKYVRLDPVRDTPQQTLGNIRVYLSAGLPSIFGFPAYDEYMNAGPDGKVAFPAFSSQLQGGHANAAVGYDDHLTIGADTGALLVRNSWGTGWGMQGYGWLPYKYVTQNLAVDWWTAVKQSWIDTGQFA